MTGYSRVDSIQSNNRTEDFTEEPFYFVQISDTHFTQLRPEIVASVHTFLQNISQKINPPAVVFSGDLTDATGGNSTYNMYSFDY